MKYSWAAGLLLAGSASALLEIPVGKRDKHTGGQTANVARGVVRRSTKDTLGTTLFSGVGYVSGGAYYANITVGTPPQLQTVLLDTGSSDLYLDSRSAPACQSDGIHSCQATEFVPGSSSTFRQLEASPAFNASYGDGTVAIGPYVQDTVCINNICIQDVQFGLATDVHSTVGPAIGLMGVGSNAIEATRTHLYPNIPVVLADAGIINSRLYSLYLNDYDAVTGSILFGGIDTDKYTGTLQTVDTLPDPITGFVDQFITVVTDLATNVGGNKQTIFSNGATGIAAYKSNTPSLPVLLDSGSSAWSVPQNYYAAIINQFAYVDPQSATAPCKNAYSGDSVTITFNAQLDVTVDVSEFLVPLYNPSTGKQETYPNGDDVCIFEIIPSAGTGEGFDTMGDAVLRSMYVVYDLDQGQMSLAQAKQNSTSSNVKAVPAGPGGVGKVANNYKSAPSQSYSIAPSVSATSFAWSTAKTAVGTATGIGAVPTAGQAPGEGSGGKSAANTLGAPGLASTLAFAAAMALLGAAVMM